MSDPGARDRMRRMRGHRAGGHANCNPHFGHCKFAADLYELNQFSIYARAMLEEMEKRGIDARDFLGEDYDDYVEKAGLDFSNYLDHEYVVLDDSVAAARGRADLRRGDPSVYPFPREGIPVRNYWLGRHDEYIRAFGDHSSPGIAFARTPEDYRRAEET